MILKIEFDAKDVIEQKNGRILLKVRHYGRFALPAHFATTEGQTVRDFAKNDAKSSRTLFVGQRGGITLGGHVANGS